MSIDDSPFYNKEDEHTVLLIKNGQRFCQQTMIPIIQKAQTTAEKSHERIDVMEDRMSRLDDKEMGKVTILWHERNRIIAIGGVLLLAILINIFSGIITSGKVDKNILREAVKGALEDIKK